MAAEKKNMDTKTPFATDTDCSMLYVKLKHSGINPLVVAFDGITTTRFGRGKTQYLTVRDVINWHEKELQETAGRSGSRSILEALQTALQNFDSGNIVDVNKHSV
jgi:hypothetical protein